jgi:hypothetical protein
VTLSEQPQQYSLFSVAEERAIYLSSQRCQDQDWSMSAAALTEWKQRIFCYQQEVQSQIGQQQASLFDIPHPETPDQLDPFTLPQQNIEFWRWQQQGEGESALYFVIDYELPLLLYVGETVKSNQRWKGEHGCKDYLASYRDLHYRHQITTTIGISFWRAAPKQTRARQKIESSFIFRWRSPFNKENWQYWGTPFVGQNRGYQV